MEKDTPAHARAPTRRSAQKAEQKAMLLNLRSWLKFRGLKQKDLANALGVSEPTISLWISGDQSMTVATLRQIAVVLQAKPEDLLRDPNEADLAPMVAESLRLFDKLSAEQWDMVLSIARVMAGEPKKN
jgi:transcriptional regulator with XRE-family HTH domain